MTHTLTPVVGGVAMTVEPLALQAVRWLICDDALGNEIAQAIDPAQTCVLTAHTTKALAAAIRDNVWRAGLPDVEGPLQKWLPAEAERIAAFLASSGGCQIDSAPRFILFEGADGVGKTTQAERLVERLAQTRPVVGLREPTNGTWGQRIRRAARTDTRPDTDEEIRWFTEDRREDVQDNIRPALREGKTVVLDRYVFSTMAYQGARSLAADEQVALLSRIIDTTLSFAIWPDLVIHLHANVDAARKRIGLRGQHDAFEAVGYQRIVTALMHDVLNRFKPYYQLCTIDTTDASVEEVADLVWAAVNAWTPTPKIPLGRPSALIEPFVTD